MGSMEVVDNQNNVNVYILMIYNKLLFVACLSLFSLLGYGQECVHELYKTADYDVHHDRKVVLNRAETIIIARTWQVQKNKDGSYTWKNYTTESGGNNGTYHEILAQTYKSSEITVSKNKISVYWEERWIRPSEFYTDAETNDPMKQGSMKPPQDPFDKFDKHKRGSSTYQDLITVGDKTFKINVQHYCTHQRIPLYRGTVVMGVGVGISTNSRGKKKATRDYFPDHFFRHQVRLSFSIDEMAKAVNMTKTDLMVYLIENSDKLGNLNINSYLERSGFIYCAYRAFALEKYKEQHARQVEEKRAERARQDSVRLLEEERIRREVEEAKQKAEDEYWSRIGIEKKTSANKAAAEGVKLVDLGLSVRWADRNIGATSPEDNGLKYKWGEISSSHIIDKYKPVRKPQKKDRLDASNDPATAKWGIGFHVPSREQWKELVEKCNIIVGKDAFFITGPNGNSISIPIPSGNNYALYWTNEMSDTSNKKAVLFSLDKEGNSTSYSWLSLGVDYTYPIRAVME
jgi:hypothetical protein